jgi:hypothetical protein
MAVNHLTHLSVWPPHKGICRVPRPTELRRCEDECGRDFALTLDSLRRDWPKQYDSRKLRFLWRPLTAVNE